MGIYEIGVFVCGVVMAVIGLTARTYGLSEKITINCPMFLSGAACIFYSFAASGLITF